MRQLFLFILLAAIVFSSCKKSSSSASTCTLSFASVVGSWAITDATYKYSATSPTVDIYNNPSYFNACQQDDYTTFNSDSTYIYVDAGVSCNPNATVRGVWSLSGSTLTTKNIYGTSQNPITSFSCASLIITYSNYDTTGDQAAFTYKKLN